MSAAAPIAGPRRVVERARLSGRTLCVLFGGRSSEREVSLVSGRAMLAALEGTLGRTGDAPAAVLGVELEPDGRWRVAGRSLEAARALEELPRDAVFVLGLHGGEGEGGRIQGLLEATGRAFTGAGVAASALCLDKHLTRLVLADAGLRVAPGRLVHPRAFEREPARVLEAAGALGTGILFVKPARGGSSLGMQRVCASDELAPAIGAVLAAGDAALVELGIDGVEATCGVLGNRGRELRALPPIEIRPRVGAYFDYAEKYGESGARELCPPQGFPAATNARLAELALRAHEVTGCDVVSHTDFIVPADGGDPVVLEVNTLPGMTPRSLVPLAAAVAGLDFAELCLELARLGLEAERERLV